MTRLPINLPRTRLTRGAARQAARRAVVSLHAGFDDARLSVVTYWSTCSCTAAREPSTISGARVALQLEMSSLLV
jgi:hypothetical protein